MLMFYSREDIIVPYEHGLELLKYSGSSYKKLSTFEGSHRDYPAGRGGIDDHKNPMQI